jgi:Ca2+-binding RTX toxin-like protein
MGNDLDNVITGFQGNDTLSGGPGDDRFDESVSAAALVVSATADSGRDTFNGGAGVDTVDYSSRSGILWAAIDGVHDSGYGTMTQTPAVNASFTNGSCALTASSEQDSISLDVENIYGGANDDCLFGQPNATHPTDGEPVRAAVTDCTVYNCQNQLVGNDGNDMLFGLDDDDVLQGGNPVNGAVVNASYAAEVDMVDCGGGQGNLGFDVGGGGGAYKATNCQL